jgi:hypothetical protein
MSHERISQTSIFAEARRMRGKGLLETMAAIAAASWVAAAASTSAVIASADAVRVEVMGNVTPYCAHNVTTASIVAGDLTAAGSSTFAFTVDCNAPFQYTMRSENGALRLVNASVSAARDTIELPYDVRIRIPLTLGGQIDDTCASSTLKQSAVSCKFTDSGAKIALNQRAEMNVSWGKPEKMLAAGQYSDRLTVTVAVKP